MTTAVIEGLANEEALIIGSADINLLIRLRRKVIPKFEMDVGECDWRRVDATISVAAADREYDLPTNFGKMLGTPVTVDSTGTVAGGFRYLGEDPIERSLAQQSTDTDEPSGFWLVNSSTSVVNKAIRFNIIPDAAYTIYYTYLRDIYFSDDTTSVELNQYIPLKFQWGLVEALKLEVFRGRLSVDDPRFTEAKEEYQRIVDHAIELREGAMRNHVKRVKTGPL